MNQDELDTSFKKSLLIVESLGSKRTLTLNSRLFSIGRHPKCSLVIKDSLISRHHATIAWLRDRDCSDNYYHWIIDGKGSRLRSKNGVFVNGLRTFLHRLCSEDVISFGSDTTITYTCLPDILDRLKVKKTVYYL